MATFEPEGGFACLIEQHRYLAALWHGGDRTLTALFAGGRAPCSGLAPLLITAFKGAVVSAFISAGIAAVTGGDMGRAFVAGFIGGFCGVFGVVGAMAGGALGACVTGGDPLQGALTAGVAAGVQVCFGFSPAPSTGSASGGQYLQELALSTASGALSGGVTAEIMGGEFSEGAAYGAASAAASYVVYEWLATYLESSTASIHEMYTGAGRKGWEHFLKSLDLTDPLRYGFEDPDAAARAAMDEIYALTHGDGHEYGGIIYKFRHKYGYTIPVRGSKDAVSLGQYLRSKIMGMPVSGKQVALFHSHPNASGFSGTRGRVPGFFSRIRGDYEFAERFKTDLYMVNTAHKYHHYRYATNQVRTATSTTPWKQQ